MGNYFLDNPDLQHVFENLDFSKIVVTEKGDEDVSDYAEGYRSSLELCGNIASEFIAPRSASIDEQGSNFTNGEVSYSEPMEEVKNCLSEAGFMGVIVPTEYGGLSFPVTVYCMMIEMVSQADASVMTLFGYQDIGETIAHYARPEVSREILPPYCEGEKVGAMVLTEPGGGTDLQAVKVSASRGSDGKWRISGTKCFISHGHRDVLLVLARSDGDSSGVFGLSLFLVKGESSNGVRINRVESKMGLHGSPTCEVSFSESIGELIGRENLGLSMVVGILNQARFSVAAQALGIAESAYRAALEYSTQRVAFGKTLYELPQIQTKLANISANQLANRALLYAGTEWLDRRNTLSKRIDKRKLLGDSISKEEKVSLRKAHRLVEFLSPLSKLVISERAVKSCYDAQQVFGGHGYIKGNTVERCARDIRITTIYEGTSEVLASAIVKYVLTDVAGDFINQTLFESDRSCARAGSELIDKACEIEAVYRQAMGELDRTDSYYMDAIAEDLVNIYGSLYIGCLLVQSHIGARNELDVNRVALTRRYLELQLAECLASLSRISSGVYATGLH